MAELPTGTVTFLFTDLAGSTALWEQHPTAMRAAVDRHLGLLRDAVSAHHGQVFRTVGDGLCAAFATAPDAVAAALQAQRALVAEDWGAVGPLAARMALHTGAAEVHDGDYVGACLNRLGRLLAAGHGGQVLLSQATADLARGDLPDSASLRDLGEQRLRDLGQDEHVYQLLHPDLPVEFPPLQSLTAVPNNLPLQLTSFVGRERELADLQAALQQARLVTLTGPGGTGKTRLALQAAAAVVERYPDGIWLVELAPLSDPGLVPQAVAAVVGVREAPGQSLTPSLVAYWRPRRALVILDNCEHLISASAALVEALLRGCSHLTILATSREVLGIGGELSWPVPALSLPEGPRAGEVPGKDALAHSEAVQLFLERASSARPSFQLTHQNGSAIALVCRRLDGMPLAIELAAARVRVLSVEEIATRLDDRFRLLTGGSRMGLPRQRTLRATIDWSHDLLSEPERALLRRLAVFAGGWSEEAAVAVCAGEDVAADEHLNLLIQLVDKSLVVADTQGASTRFRLLETIRAYAWERLDAVGEAGSVQDRHAAFFVAFAEDTEPKLMGGGRTPWLERLDAEHDNVRAALRWLLDGGRTASALRLAGALRWYWYLRGYLEEGGRWLREALGLPDADRFVAERAKALYAAGVLAFYRGDYAAGQALLTESAEQWRGVGEARMRAYALIWLGLAAGQRSDDALARCSLEESIALFRQQTDPWGLALARSYLGVYTALRPGLEAEAWPLLEDSARTFRSMGDMWALGAPLYYLGLINHRQGEDQQARGRYEQCLAIFRESGDKWRAATVMGSLGDLAYRTGDYGRAAVLYREQLALSRELGDRYGLVGYVEWTARLTVALAQGARSARLFGAAAGLRKALGVSARLSDQSTNERVIETLRTKLDQETFDTAWAAGYALTLEEALAEAEAAAASVGN